MAKPTQTFVKLVVAMIKGDDAEVQAIKSQKKARAALSAQIAVKDAHTLTLEDELESSQDELSLARINSGEPISNGSDYISKLLSLRREIKLNEDKLNNHNEIISFLKEQLEEVNK